jgi:4-hydroxy-tetrahydrodipicolinate reductase
MIEIVMHGCQGKMGRAITAAVELHPDMTICYGIDRNRTAPLTYPVYYPIGDAPGNGDVIIDFSSHDAISDVLEYATVRKIPLVLASTGITVEEQMSIDDASKVIPIFQAPNFSIGINLLAACVEMLMPVLEKDFDAAVIDKHHREKKDAPSGTALQLAGVAESVSNIGKKVEVAALRIGTIPGEHTVVFAGPDEVIELKHTAYSRDVFAQGALKAARFLVGKPPGKYAMKDLIAQEIGK